MANPPGWLHLIPMPQTEYADTPTSPGRRIIPWVVLFVVLLAGLVLLAVYGPRVVPVFFGTPA